MINILPARGARRTLAVSCLRDGPGASTTLTIPVLWATVVLLLLSASAGSLIAATYTVPEDRELIVRSDVIGVLTAVGSHAELAASGVVRTIYEMRLDDVLKGPVRRGATIQLVERGGAFGGVATMIPGSPRYDAGRQYLVFAETSRDGDLQTWGMQIGRFIFESNGGRKIFTHGGSEIFGFDHNFDPYVDRPRDVTGFLEYIRGIVTQTIDPEPRYFVEFAAAGAPVVTSSYRPAVNATGTSYILAFGGFPFRWQTPGYGFVLSGSAGSLDGTGGANGAVSGWNGAVAAVHVSVSGQDNTAVKGFTGVDGKNAILFNDPNSELPSGADGIGGVTNASSQYSYEGGMVWQPAEVDVVMGKNSVFSSQSCLNSVLAHEVGHTLAMRHSDRNPADDGPCTAPLDCASVGSALMATTTMCSFNGNLQAWDNRAIQAVYGTGAACTAPSITVQPAGLAIASGQSANLSVTAIGTATLSYQWYQGSTGNTSTPVGTNSSSFNTGALTTSTSYWVRVTGQCTPVADSNTATVTVTGGCTPPSITVQPAGSTIASGQSANLSVSATGTATLSYQWYAGTTGNTSTPVGGGTSSSISVSPTSTTSYWVRVTGQCSPVADSNTATVTVSGACPSITVSTPTAVQVAGGFVLNATASGGSGLTFSWLQVLPNGGASLVAIGNPITVNPSSATTYFVRVSNNCGTNADSPQITVTPSATCNAPAISSVVATPSSISAGASSTLSVVATGSSLNYQWYVGQPGNTSSPVAGGAAASVNVSPSQTTAYWVQVSSGCGAQPANSTAVTVAVCVTTTFTQPSNQTIVSLQSATITIVATGLAPLHYQWYRGGVGDDSHPVGTDSATFNTGALTSTTGYWVTITNTCGMWSSNTILISVVPPGRRRSARH